MEKVIFDGILPLEMSKEEIDRMNEFNEHLGRLEKDILSGMTLKLDKDILKLQHP